MSFFVSVIIPVYNAERFIEKAILSVLEQQEVLEVIIVNDGSTDSSINIVKKLQEKEVKIKIFQHSNEINKGRSASRNLGIKNAQSPYIAFLDADDYFLPNRFKHDESIFKNIENCDGVYNAIGVHFYREASPHEFQDLELYSVKEITPPDELFKNLFLGGKGHFSIDGLTVKKTIFDKVGFFNESLAVAEDTELIWKMALKCQLITGQIKEAVAVRGVHDENVFNQTDLYKTYFFKLLESLLFWSVQNASLKQVDIILNRIWLIKYKEDKNLFLYIKYWSYLMAKQPKLICSILSIKYFPIIRLRKKLFPYLFR